MGCTSSTSVVKQNEGAIKQKQVAQKKHIDSSYSKVERKKQLKQDDYSDIDNHARKAPSSLKNSPKKLVEYLMQASTEQKMVVRAIFIWITENIRYDVEGYFGRAPAAPTDAEDVMKCGKSVCQGYASVMELLCREANIEVKLLSGYSKGYGSSANKTIKTNDDTDHAWKAVQLDGKWHLIDCTWAAGHLNRSTKFEKKFQPFYFLTKPEHFINDNFPYMNNDMEESKTWQLLEKPVRLEEFNKNLKKHPLAFELDVTPVTHKHGLIDMKIEETIEFRNDGSLEIDAMAALKHLDGNTLIEQSQNVFVTKNGPIFKVKVHPNRTGLFHLNIFGKNKFQDGVYHQLFEYVLNCTKIDDVDFEYPKQYPLEDRCELIKPMQFKLKANTEVEFHLTSVYLLRIMIEDTISTKEKNAFKETFKTGQAGETVTIYGSRELEGSLSALYEFKIV